MTQGLGVASAYSLKIKVARAEDKPQYLSRPESINCPPFVDTESPIIASVLQKCRVVNRLHLCASDTQC
jgi:hypothetical protein